MDLTVHDSIEIGIANELQPYSVGLRTEGKWDSKKLNSWSPYPAASGASLTIKYSRMCVPLPSL